MGGGGEGGPFYQEQSQLKQPEAGYRYLKGICLLATPLCNLSRKFLARIVSILVFTENRLFKYYETLREDYLV